MFFPPTESAQCWLLEGFEIVAVKFVVIPAIALKVDGELTKLPLRMVGQIVKVISASAPLGSSTCTYDVPLVPQLTSSFRCNHTDNVCDPPPVKALVSTLTSLKYCVVPISV